MGAADDEDEIRFDFRDPLYSDGDDVDDYLTPKDSQEEIECTPAPNLADISYEGNLDYPSSGRHDPGVTYQETPHIVGESSEAKTAYRYIQASHLEKSLEAALLSILGGHQSEGERPSSDQGATSEVHALTSEIVLLGILLTLEDDLRLVLSRLGNLSEEALDTTIFPSQRKECTYTRLDYPAADGSETEEPEPGGFRPGVHEETWTQSSAQITTEPSETVEEDSDARRPKLVIRIRKKDIRRWNREKRLLAQSERDTGSCEFGYSVPEPATTPNQSPEVVEHVQDSYACSSPCPRTSTDEQDSIVKIWQDVLADDVVGLVKHANTTEHEEFTSAESSLEATPDLESEEIRKEADWGEALETPATPPGIAFEPAQLQGRSSARESRRVRESGRSVWQRMEARFLMSAWNKNLHICSICGTQQNFATDGDNCKICSDKQRNFQPLNYVKLWYPVVLDLGLTYLISPLHQDMTFQFFTNPMSFQGHRAILLRLPSGNIMWDCLTYIDEKSVLKIAGMGGLRAIALSSPERISACPRLSYIFNRCSVYLHASGREFLSKEVGKRARKFWEGSTEILWDGVTLIHLGGRYPGSCILHLDRKGGIVFASNTLKVGKDRQSVGVMLDYHNLVPASQKDVQRILYVLEDLEFNELWGDQPGEQILDEAKPIVIASLRRYLRCAEHNEDATESDTEPLSKREIIARGKRKINEM